MYPNRNPVFGEATSFPSSRRFVKWSVICKTMKEDSFSNVPAIQLSRVTSTYPTLPRLTSVVREAETEYGSCSSLSIAPRSRQGRRARTVLRLTEVVGWGSLVAPRRGRDQCMLRSCRSLDALPTNNIRRKVGRAVDRAVGGARLQADVGGGTKD